MRNNKGITLLALAITIILLLILAGVVLNLTLGENGIIQKALVAKEEYLNASEKEKKQLENLYSEMKIATNGEITINIEDLNKIIDMRIKETKAISNPVGSVISQMGTKAPEGYLVCDGQTHNIEDYKELAEYIKGQFGTYSYWGGDGETTFAVPDLRGEFLRGTGTGARNTGTGGTVGVHQDATSSTGISARVEDASRGILWFTSIVKRSVVCGNEDKIFTDVGSGRYEVIVEGRASAVTWNNSSYYAYTSRPTNTAVLYCIKY